MFCHKKKTLKCLILSLKTWQISFLFFLANTFCNISYYPSFCQFPNRLSFGGIVLRHYLEANVSRSTRTSIRYFMKMLANISETIIFMFLGLSAIVDTLDWNLSFIFFALLFCLVFRVLGIYIWLIRLFFVINGRSMKFQQDQKIYDKYNSISIKNWSCIMTLSINKLINAGSVLMIWS